MRRAGRLDSLHRGIHVMDQEAEAVHADEVPAALAGGLPGLVVQQARLMRCSSKRRARFPIGLTAFLHAQGAHVELGRLPGIGTVIAMCRSFAMAANPRAIEGTAGPTPCAFAVVVALLACSC